MKKLIAVAGLGAAVAVGTLMGASPASASSSTFLNDAQANGFYNAAGGTNGILNDGYRACNMLNAGWSFSQTVNEIWVNEDMTYGDAVVFVSLAAKNLC